MLIIKEKIEETTKRLNESQEKYDKREELLRQRIVAMYEAGETTYLDVLLASEDIADFISKYHYVEEIAKCDQNLLNQIQKNKTRNVNEL